MVHEAPSPALTGFECPHDRVSGILVVLGGMSSRRGVAPADVAAVEAQSQLHRVLALAQTLDTRVAQRGGFRVRQRVGMRALFHDCQITTGVRMTARKNEGGRGRWT